MPRPCTIILASLLLAPALAGAKERDLPKSVLSLHDAWEQLEDTAYEARDSVTDAIDAIKQKAKSVNHDRPLLLSSYVTVARQGERVVLIHCDSRLRRLRSRQACEKLHTSSFKIGELKSCLESASENKQPGMILNRNLAASLESDYSYDFFKMYDSKENYKEYLRSCRQRLSEKKKTGPNRSMATAPAYAEPEYSDFKAVEIDPIPYDSPDSVEEGGTL